MSEQRLIKTTYEIVTPESAAESDAAERGYVDQEGAIMHGPASAAAFLLDHGATEASSSPFAPGSWYSWPDARISPATGAAETHSFHLSGFTPDEERQIHSAVRAGIAPAETPEEARRRVEAEYKVVDGIIRNPGRFESEPCYVAWLLEENGEWASGEYGKGFEGYEIDEDVRRAFSEIGDAEMVAIWTDEQGFCRHKLLSKAEWQALKLNEQDSAFEP